MMKEKPANNKIRKLFITTGLIFFISGIGCAPKGSQGAAFRTEATTTAMPTCTPTPKPVITEEQLAYLQVDITLTEEQITQFTKQLHMEVNYPYSEYFELEKALAMYENTELTEVISNNMIQDNVVDADKLYERVLKNNADYLMNGKDAGKYTEFTEEEIREFCDLISDVLTKKLAVTECDTNTLDYVLSNLKIFNYEYFSVSASVTTDYCLIISKNFIDADSDIRAMEKTITHECMHMMQIGMGTKVYGICYEFEELAVNPLYPLWFVEASAEWASHELTGEYRFYQSERNYMEALAVAMFADAEKLENYNFDHDLYQFYTNLECEGLISREEIASMMFAVEIAVRGNDEFAELYKEKTGNYFVGEEMRSVKQQYKDGAHITMAKKFYYDLCRGTYTLKDAFSLMSLFELASVDNVRCKDLEYLETPMTFLKEYTAMQDAYMGVLAECLGAEKADIWNLYNTYFDQHDIKIDGTEQNERMNQMVVENQSRNWIPLNVYYRENVEQ